MTRGVWLRPKRDYGTLERTNKTNRIDDWLEYFAHTVLNGLDNSRAWR